MAALTPLSPLPAGVVPPTPWLVRLFGCYVRRYLRRHFHAVRLAWPERPTTRPTTPLIIYLNHPAWWDPLISFVLAYQLFPEREHYGPIDAEALARYRLFTHLGFFGIASQTRQGAATFLRQSQAILQRPTTVLWLTPSGAFTDPRTRPVSLRPGLGHLVRRLERCTLLPLALEYPFWEERLPEALARFGAPVVVTAGSTQTAKAWTQQLAQHLEAAQDALQRDACQRERAAFDLVLRGRVGVGGLYDLWRACRAHWRGETWQRAHGVAEW